MKLAIFLPNWIGDVVMATPTLRAIRRHYGSDARLVGVLRPHLADVLAGTPWLDDQIHYAPKSPDPALRTRAVIGRLRSERPDACVLLPNSFRAGALAWASGAKQRVGYARYGRGPLLTTKLYAPRVGRKYLPTPAIDAYLQLAYALGCELESPRLELATTTADEAAADRFWRKAGLPWGDRVVTLNSGGAFGAAKHWPSEHFGELAARLAADGLSVLVNCGPAEREIARRIVAVANSPSVVSLADEETPIGMSKAVIRRSRLLVSTDSGPRFFAVALGVPVVSLFGPTHIAWSRTHSEREICLSHAVDCGPCMRRVCPLGHHQCMRDLTVDTVYRAVVTLLSRSNGRQVA